MKKCKACGHQYRSGRIVFLLTSEGLKGSRVCSKCAESGATIVSATSSVKPTAKSQEELDVRQVLRGLARKLRGLSKSYRRTLDTAPKGSMPPHVLLGVSRMEGLEEGLEKAAEIAEAWALNPAIRV